MNKLIPKKFIKTGELHFQFENEASSLIIDIMNHQTDIKFTQSKEQDKELPITFTSSSGQKFSIIIKPTEERIKIFSRKHKFNNVSDEIGFFKKLLQRFRTK